MKDFVYSVTSLVLCLIVLFQSEIMYGSECSDRFSESSLEQLEELFEKASTYSRPVFVRPDLIKKSELYRIFKDKGKKPLWNIFGRTPIQEVLINIENKMKKIDGNNFDAEQADLSIMSEIYKFLYQAINIYEMKYIYYKDSPHIKTVSLLYKIITSDVSMQTYQQTNFSGSLFFNGEVDIQGMDEVFSELEDLFIEANPSVFDTFKNLYGDECHQKLNSLFKTISWSIGNYLYHDNKFAILKRIQQTNSEVPRIVGYGIVLSSNTMLVSASIFDFINTEDLSRFDDRLSVLKNEYVTNALRVYFIYDNMGREKYALLRFIDDTFKDVNHLQLNSYLGISDIDWNNLSSSRSEQNLKSKKIMNVERFAQELKRILSLDSRLKIEGLGSSENR